MKRPTPYSDSEVPRRPLALTGANPEAELQALSAELSTSRRWLLFYGRTDYGDPQKQMSGWLVENYTTLQNLKLSGVECILLGPKTKRSE